jgi:predicted DCC family thiol-disulfide oxidoreductase YuxK
MTLPAHLPDAPIAFMDRDCALCGFGARVIHRMDRGGDIRICPIQSETGQAVLAHYEMVLDDPDSWIFLDAGTASFDFDAVIRLGVRCGGFGRLLAVLRLLPRPARDGLYRLIARNRYRMFGKGDLCALPDSAFQRRLLH